MGDDPLAAAIAAAQAVLDREIGPLACALANVAETMREGTTRTGKGIVELKTIFESMPHDPPPPDPPPPEPEPEPQASPPPVRTMSAKRDNIADFITAECTCDPGARTRRSDLWRSYAGWSQRGGTSPGGKSDFFAALGGRFQVGKVRGQFFVIGIAPRVVETAPPKTAPCE